MAITNALAGLAVRDLAASSRWYEKILGPSTNAMTQVVEWHLEAGGGLQVYTAPERAGHSSCTLIVSDRVDIVMIKDPDGNSIAFAMSKDASLVQ